MAELEETIRLVELVCARLCHDLGGLIGTVGNALDLAAEEADGASEVIAFAASAAKALVERVRLARAAWGPEGEPLSLGGLTDLVSAPLAARRIGLDVRMVRPDSSFTAPFGRVILNLILLAADCLKKGGVIVLIGQSDDLLARIDGPDAAWPAGLAVCLRDEQEALAALTNAGSVQMPLTVLLAFSRHLSVTLVLGPASGIEAIRLRAP
jgi:histidine phosphotransferase ChpT